MHAEPQLLLESSIAHLQTLAAYFADEIGNCGNPSRLASVEAQACKEALLTISVLIPKLRVARMIVAGPPEPGRRCLDCDD